MAKFKIRQTFYLTRDKGKVLVAAGDFISGVIHVGDTICLKKKYIIHDIGYLDFADRSYMVALSIKAKKEDVLSFINKTVTILPTHEIKKTQRRQSKI